MTLIIDLKSTQKLRDKIDDLEVSLDVNKTLIAEILANFKKDLQEPVPPLDKQISDTVLETVQIENLKLQEVLMKMNCEIDHANTLLAICEERTTQSKIRKKEAHKKYKNELRRLKQDAYKKDQEIRTLESYLKDIENIEKNETKSAEEIILQESTLIRKVNKQVEDAQEVLIAQENNCRDMEKVLRVDKKDRVSKIAKKKYWLNLAFEEFWFGEREDSESEDTDSFSEDFKVKENKTLKLEIANYLKNQEIQSLVRTLADLKGIEVTLLKGLEMKNNEFNL